MDFKFGVFLVISAYICTSQALPPCTCTRNYQPICGSDGETYNNQCLLDCVKYSSNKDITVVKEGVLLVISAYICTSQALPPCTCTRNYEPICGSDGETYSNQCLLDCAKDTSNKDITVVREGPCESVPPNEVDCMCTFNYAPVCGTDGNTYSNQCSLECKSKSTAGLEMSYTGPCVEPTTAGFLCSCTREKKPVCGSDGVTYSNDCLLNCATAKNPMLSIANYGPCVDKVKVAEIKF